MSRDRTADLAGFLDAVRDRTRPGPHRRAGRGRPSTCCPTGTPVHLLRMVMFLERETGRSVPVSSVLQARSMRRSMP
ncbi:hypothetical protein ACRAWF_31825 [Streptomyces sp. L7]